MIFTILRERGQRTCFICLAVLKTLLHALRENLCMIRALILSLSSFLVVIHTLSQNSLLD